ncbi:MAG TPA: adenylate/guanylate cyclase domain-containing protein [Acidimicrobiales bacterium]|nr:adenylate/guanylate cyclase domain-containing protein [Acidimicrobiales bacterium]
MSEPGPVQGKSPVREAPAGVRVFRCFAFLDLCGFTELGDEFGDDAAVSELRTLRELVRAETTHWGVRVDKWLGDGVMLVGVEVEPVVRTVLAIFAGHAGHGRLPLRGGIACGRVILMEGDDYVGRVVNVASRLCDTAGAGEVLCSRETVEDLDWLEGSQAVGVQVKGFHDVVPAVAIHP